MKQKGSLRDSTSVVFLCVGVEVRNQALTTLCLKNDLSFSLPIFSMDCAEEAELAVIVEVAEDLFGAG